MGWLFADPTRLVALGSSRLIRFGATRGVQIRKPIADKLLDAARDALPMPDAAIARQVLAADLALASDLDLQVAQAEVELARLLPASPFRTLTSVPGWAVVRAGNYAGALGDPARFSNPRQVYRSAGLNPIQYESAGKRHDTRISREGSVELRRALIDLGMGLWLNEPAATARAVELRARGKKGAVIACAMAHRANRIAFALVRTRPSTTRAAGPDHSRSFLDHCRLRRGEERSTWSARSAARTNDVDGDEQRRILEQRGRAPTPARTGGHHYLFTTPAGRATLGGTKDPDQTPFRLWRTRKGYAATSLAPGSFAMTGSPNEAS